MSNKALAVLLYLCFIHSVLFATGDKVSTLVIDPGHGGKDAGAVGKHSYEKNIALSVALKFGDMVSANFPDVKVIYTRKDDRFVELRQRGRIANQNHADLFVSIHCNSTDNKSAKGVETWIMGNHKNDANLKVAQLENSAILQEQNHEENYDNFDPSSPDAYIIFSLYQNAFMDQSLGFASKVQDQYISRFNTPNRGIKQAGFLVLWACALPSVLTEIGFISNLEEEKFLMSEEGQDNIATSLFQAFKEYKYQVEGFNNQVQSSNVVIPESKPIESSITKNNPITKENSNLTTESIKATSAPTIIFKVQFASSSTNKNLNSPEFANIQELSKYEENGLYKYCSGEAYSPDQAQKLLKQVQSAGYKDAFIIGFSNGIKISTQEAYRILQERNK